MGRPKVKAILKRESQTLRLPKWLIDWLDHKEESAGRIVEDALIERHRLEPPDD